MLFEGPVLFPLVGFVAGNRTLGCFLGSFLLANEANEHHFKSGGRSAWSCFVALLFQSPGPTGAEPWCLNVALHFDYPVVNGLFVFLPVLSCFYGGYVLLLCYTSRHTIVYATVPFSRQYL